MLCFPKVLPQLPEVMKTSHEKFTWKREGGGGGGGPRGRGSVETLGLFFLPMFGLSACVKGNGCYALCAQCSSPTGSYK